MKLDLIDFEPSDIAQSNFANHFTLISLKSQIMTTLFGFLPSFLTAKVTAGMINMIGPDSRFRVFQDFEKNCLTSF